MKVRSAILFFCLAAGAAELPPGVIVEARLSSAAGSAHSKPGDSVRAVILSPPPLAGAAIEGRVMSVTRLGFGLRHSHARLGIRFDTIRTSAGETLPLAARLVRVDSAREQVDDAGVIHGISLSMSASALIAAYAWRAAVIAPAILPVVWVGKLAFARSPNPEIELGSGRELLLELVAPLEVSAESGTERVSDVEPLQNSIAALPALRVRNKSGALSDRLNLAFSAEREVLQRAFAAAGWTDTKRRNLASFFRVFVCLVQRSGHPQAPMSPLFLDDREPDLAFQKGFNTFARRHHLRIWRTDSSIDGKPVWVAAATEDIHIGFSFRAMRWVHVIDPEIDSERTKVASDLRFTGCVKSEGLLAADATIVPGVLTDSRIAALDFSACTSPRAMPMLYKPGKGHAISSSFASLGRDLIRTNALSLGMGSLHFLKRSALTLGTRAPAVRPRNVWARQQSELLNVYTR